jgi:transposase-like protein
MPRIRKNHPPALKAKVAVEAIKCQRTTSEIAHAFGIHPNLAANWKRQALELLPELLVLQEGGSRSEPDAGKEELYRQIGQMKVELDFLKKSGSSGISVGSG